MDAKRPNVGGLHDPGLTFEHLSTLASHNGARVFFNQRSFTALPRSETAIRPRRLFKDQPSTFQEKLDFLAARPLLPAADYSLRTSIVAPIALVSLHSHGR